MMPKLPDILPLALTEKLNSFNESLSHMRRRIKLESTSIPVKINNSNFDEVRIKYKVLGTSFYFQINFVVKGDYIHWSYYPAQETSSKPKGRQRSQVATPVYQELSNNFKTWSTLISLTNEIEDPLDYFNEDNLIEFYSFEVQDHLETTEAEETYPLSSRKQSLAIALIEKQTKFLDQEITIEAERNPDSEKHFDLLHARNNLLEIKENIPRMTVADVKKKWSISLGVIMKWCAQKFITFSKLDSKNGHDISRTIGSFIGGVFGIPSINS